MRKIEGVDLGGGNDHASAAERYRRWLKLGVLRQDSSPAVYVHRHQFEQHGVVYVRTGLMTRVRLAEWTKRIVLPHEQTTPGPKKERLDRLRAVQANLSPLYFLYRDPDGQIRDLIASATQSSPAVEDLDQLGGGHRLTPVVNTTFHARLAAAFADRTVFVADGHHRYEAALSYRNECRAAHGSDPETPSEFVLTMLTAVEDPGVIVCPTHRILAHGSNPDPALFLEELRRWFRVRNTTAEEPMPVDEFVCRVVLPAGQDVWDLHAKPGNPHHRLLPADRGPAWRSLGVAAVEGIAERILGDNGQKLAANLLPAIDERDAIAQVRNGSADGAFLLPTPTIDSLLAVAEEGDLLPAKSSWFEPKAPAGLVINDLRL